MTSLDEAVALLRGGRSPADVLAVFERLANGSQRPDPHHWHGVVLRELGRVDDAIAAFRRAVAMDPTRPGTQYYLAEVLLKRAVLDEAIAVLRETIRLIQAAPGQQALLADAHSDLGFALMMHGEQEAAIKSFRSAMALRQEPGYHAQLVYYLRYLPTADDAAVLREARAWDQLYGAPLTAAAPPCDNDPSPDRKLRVGYVSADLREHAVASFLPPVFEGHDRAAFEVTAYSNVARPDHVTDAFRAHADRWRDVTSMDDEAAARQVREDRIDILLDLSMHTGGARPLVFARKPAPVQIAWLAYPGTTGMTCMDYRITDPHLDPPAVGDDAYSRAYTERALRLPDSFWCYRPQLSPPVGPLPAQSAGHITFGTGNNFSKVHDGTLKLWARVLQATPRSKILLVVPSFTAQARVRERFGKLGVGPDRIEMVGGQKMSDYLANYGRIDIGLDTLPCAGGTTSLDALYMGVPVVTQAGRAIGGRAGVCFAANLGMPELVADTADDYVRIATRLASDPARLSEIRGSLRARLTASPLMDEGRFVRALEMAYRNAWREWCASRVAQP